MLNQRHKNVLTRRGFIKRSLYTGLAGSIPTSLWISGCGKKPKSKYPNIILISIDTLRADHLGSYGYKRPTSPAIDEFGSKAMIFEDATSTSPWTLPAHGTMLTGLYPNRHGLKYANTTLDDNIVTLADILKGHGFSTASIVNSNYLTKRYGLDKGFDHFTLVREEVGLDRPSDVEDHAYKWFSGKTANPFFLFLHYFDVHSDYSSLPRYEQQFIRPYEGKADGSTIQLLNFRKGLFSLGQKDIERIIDLYDAGIRQMDDGIGRLLSFLKQKDLYDNSYIIITSDHGEEFLEHGDVLHGRTQFQELVHVPLIIRGPGLPENKRIKESVSLVDLMPTILSLVGISPPEGLDGMDISDLYKGSGRKHQKRLIFSEADHNNVVNNKGVHDIKRAVRQSNYKLHYDLITKQSQLYDLAADPLEKNDISSTYPYLAKSLFEELKSFMRTNKTGKSIILSPDEIKRLKSLGYLQ